MSPGREAEEVGNSSRRSCRGPETSSEHPETCFKEASRTKCGLGPGPAPRPTPPPHSRRLNRGPQPRPPGPGPVPHGPASRLPVQHLRAPVPVPRTHLKRLKRSLSPSKRRRKLRSEPCCSYHVFSFLNCGFWVSAAMA